MYRGIVEPHFSYCCSVWDCCSETKFNPLQKIQNRAARRTTNSPYDASAVPLLQNLGCPSIKDLNKKETATLTYKALNSLAPQYLGELFSKCSGGQLSQSSHYRNKFADAFDMNMHRRKSIFSSWSKIRE